VARGPPVQNRLLARLRLHRRPPIPDALRRSWPSARLSFWLTGWLQWQSNGRCLSGCSGRHFQQIARISATLPLVRRSVGDATRGPDPVYARPARTRFWARGPRSKGSRRPFAEAALARSSARGQQAGGGARRSPSSQAPRRLPRLSMGVGRKLFQGWRFLLPGRAVATTETVSRDHRSSPPFSTSCPEGLRRARARRICGALVPRGANAQIPVLALPGLTLCRR